MPQEVKQLDEIDAPPLIEHIGWNLWRASQLWQQRLRTGMVAAGHAWFGEARAAVIPHLERSGTRQAELVTRMGLSKQAVQQLVDALVLDGIVERRADPADARGRLVCFTQQGLRVLADANAVKRGIEDDFRASLGPQVFSALNDALERLVAQPAPMQAPE